MKAMLLDVVCDFSRTTTPLRMTACPVPVPGDKEILIKVTACGVCHTELDEIEERTPPPRFPVILGHQVVGTVVENGRGARRHATGDRAGAAWIFSACGRCEYCRQGLENLCDDFRATGRDADGGYAEYMVVHEAFAVSIPDVFSELKQRKIRGAKVLHISG